MQSVQDVNVSKETNIMKTVLRTIVFVFKLCGIYMETDGCPWYKRVLCIMYSVIVSVFIWADNIRLVIILSNEDDIRRFLSFLVFVLAYFVQSFYYIIFVRTLCNKLPAIFEEFQKYHEEYKLNIDWRRWLKNVKIFTVASVLVYTLEAVASAATYNMNVLSQDSILNMQIYPANVLSNQGLSILFVLFVLLKIAYIIIFHNYLTVFFCVISRAITKEYINVRENISSHVRRLSKENVIYNNAFDIRSLRKRHIAITDLTKTSNDVMKHIAAMQYTVTIPVVCLILYGLIHGKLVAEDVTILSFNIILHFLVMLLITHFGTQLNKEAHSSFDILYKTDLEKLESDAISEIQVFLMRLKGPPIGIDVYGFFTIDSTSILMLMGTLLTYAVVALQMAPYQETSTPVLCICNTTSM